MRDRGEAAVARLDDPLLPVRVGAAVAIVGDSLEARDGFSGCRQVAAYTSLNRGEAVLLRELEQT